ncbi:DUF1120 domain-containing protein [Pseudomonas arsenicoxydans]|uniref:DUF1120 domain-containing protein n=1 Tax=Pseudomonas arsenicoxydans TaxID=702115 RepID=A0A4V0YKS5_9PSED|nr:DUF1120 domain-containing protein [Pseudomonas arsenicoxydans]QAY88164.1 hypothetical protein CUN61_31275 [Pseudomonas arsenicoxydans]
MMKKYFAALSATALISVAPYALAASSTDLTVTGTITPNACVPLLSGRGIVEHGKISSKDLNQEKNTRLPNKTLQLTVNCDSAIAFRLKPIDNRPGTDTDDGAAFGLGFINGDQKLGFVEARLLRPLGDGEAVRHMFSYNNGGSWGNTNALIPGAISAFGAVGGPNTPIAIKDLVTDFEVRTYIARADSLDLTNDVALDGSVTIDIDYP